MKLIEAAQSNDLELAKKLIKNGYPLNEKVNSGWTALLVTSSHGRVEITKELIEAGVPLNTKNNNGTTALITASWNGHTDIVKLLLKSGASINEKDDRGCTALLTASWGGHINIIKELIKHGASLYDKDDCGKTASDYNKEIWQSKEIQDLISKRDDDILNFNAEKARNKNDNTELKSILYQIKSSEHNKIVSNISISEYTRKELEKRGFIIKINNEISW